MINLSHDEFPFALSTVGLYKKLENGDIKPVGFVDLNRSILNMLDGHTVDDVDGWVYGYPAYRHGVHPMIYPTKEQYQVYDIWIKALLRNIKFFSTENSEEY